MMAISTTAVFDGREISRQEIEAWELKRGRRAIRLIAAHLGPQRVWEFLSDAGLTRIEPESVSDMRQMLGVLKGRLGPDGIRELTRSKCKRSRIVIGAVLALSRGRRKLCTIDVLAEGIGAKAYVEWFMRAHHSNDEATMLAANPDHWLISLASDGTQEVIETVGNSPLPSHIFIGFNDEDRPELQPDPKFPVQMTATARFSDGRVVGRVRHQFRDEGNGLRARLGIEMPRAFPGPILRGHYWHLACEFSNWIEAAARDTSD
ncbi:MAG: hypothetical protein GY725_04375 [bacterium]|nr:hypothetical protein [bacterium]